MVRLLVCEQYDGARNNRAKINPKSSFKN